MARAAGAYLRARGLSKSFGHVRALQDVDVDLFEGEVLAVVGDNGAGKSTLIKILSGAYLPDQGEIWLEGQKVEYRSPLQALKLGIGAIYQELNLVYQLNVAENIMLGQVPSVRGGSIDRVAMHRRARDVLRQLGVRLDTRISVSELNVAQQQVVCRCPA